ncbi:hypothetical protein Caci_6957 [Catenulispora acidiphila DSM 44928]|uniref:SUKH-4 immunity protein n=2 Tax=Catenulispora TaxID=414878 RepID=C7Q3M3_CATAD|nr:hypothetical protein Caci_6957 [Catenulispora acidiphila DSM 44928]
MSAVIGMHRYPQEYVATVRAADARDYLVTTGLPEQSSIFVAAEGGELSAGGRDLLQVSDAENGGSYFIDRDSGEIMLWDGELGNLVYVNASPRQFGESVAIFEEATAGSSQDEAEEIAARLRVELETLDPSALRDETGFWQSLLMDVSIGDYADDDE